jgi:hypothetical protein
MYHGEMQVKFEYGCDPIIMEGIIALAWKLLESEFPFIFSLMVRWIQRLFGIHMYHEEMQIKFEYGWGSIIIGEVIALGLWKLHENQSLFISQWLFNGFKLYLLYRCIMKGCRLSSNMGAVRLLLE